MKIKIIFGVILILCILVISSNVSAIRLNASDNECEKSNQTVKINDLAILKLNLKKRITSLLNDDISFINIIKNPDDPDGPLSGGLDDPSDFSALLWAFLDLIVFLPFSIMYIFNPANSLQFFVGVFGALDMSFAGAMYLGEALDLIEFEQDGS